MATGFFDQPALPECRPVEPAGDRDGGDGLSSDERLDQWIDGQITEDRWGYKTASVALVAFARRRAMGLSRELDHATFETFEQRDQRYGNFVRVIQKWADERYDSSMGHSLLLYGP